MRHFLFLHHLKHPLIRDSLTKSRSRHKISVILSKMTILAHYGFILTQEIFIIAL